MNCDDVFEALTNPALSQSSELDAHLANCPRCRQLQQVLEPALSLLCGDLPAELVPSDGSPRKRPETATATPVLSVEAVGLAETIAGQLAASSGGKNVPPRPPFGTRRFVAALVRSAALVLFGAFAVYCVGSRDRESDLRSLPGVAPLSKPAGTCARFDLERRGQTRPDARRVILSCVGCHLNERPPHAKPTSTSLFWPRRGTPPTFSLASDDVEDWAIARHSVRCASA